MTVAADSTSYEATGRFAGVTAPAVVAWAVALCFAALTVAKLAEPDATLDVLREVWHFGDVAADAAFVALIGVEALVIALLLVRPWRTFGFAATAAFLVIVSASPVRQLVEGSTVGCGCGGTTGPVGPAAHWQALGRNAVLLSLTIFGLWQSPALRAASTRLIGRLFLPLLRRRTPCSIEPSTPAGAATSPGSPS